MFNNKKKVVVVVDAYSTGKYLPPEIIKRGYSWIHVKSRSNLPIFMTYGVKHQSHLLEIIYEGDLSTIINQISLYEIVAIIAGTETAVELTDQLAYALSLPGNSPKTSFLRRNKYQMIEAIKKAGLNTANQIATSSLKDLICWYQMNFVMNEMVVIKPLNSAGTDHVMFCSSVEEIKQAAKKILGEINKLGLLNQLVLGQSFLIGDEYVVNTVSMDGKHHLTDIWQCYKQRVQGAGFVPGCEVLLSSQGERQKQLKEYAFKALKALGFSQGPAHFEIMFTEGGPTIIEVGARVQGGVNPKVHLECIGSSQLIKTIDSYIDPKKFLSYYKEDYLLSKYSRWADLIVPRGGIIRSFTLLDEVKQLPSFYSANVSVEPGDYLPKTVDLYTSPGSIYLVNEDPELLKNDYLVLRELEKQSYEFITE
ncbi:ATP-grasp domain-containing protein [Allofrancisella guangzhouensis]|uniref:ATP-grasp domain-containing protein n=1 Tax=Allofrancisella guangzhouensis TaxID=594679 RepID=A0A0A8E3C8_9GAMM|nr:ATP-grasp domain-containing protein [Allofrancisella guangzhouensis]AJC48730.1 hypothetical protein SD28_03270 [Allofrancisella guangzhouensis]MBK2027391.1 ATP-grasp domain-containing protein [Allofrancisella guangzhouensis]MBK2043667.1 ATP-grasp domain-containing protein [Allofrancisella guangzhouensis]MBK2045193.1 ATP-grasp domain-containing protein [Allofrancisella guangzhouensis]